VHQIIAGNEGIGISICLPAARAKERNLPMTTRNPVSILMAEDDPDDQLLVQRAFASANLAPDLRFVNDGEELLDYLYHRDGHSEETSPQPGLILLDLNMPKKDGREALMEIKTDPELREIPVVVLTTSNREEDIFHAYALGASSYIVKPLVFFELVQIVKTLDTYWLETVRLPPCAEQTRIAQFR
jgi:CheY-like chemotaxis protein